VAANVKVVCTLFHMNHRCLLKNCKKPLAGHAIYPIWRTVNPTLSVHTCKTSLGMSKIKAELTQLRAENAAACERHPESASKSAK
jgi:hypothetical protein